MARRDDEGAELSALLRADRAVGTARVRLWHGAEARPFVGRAGAHDEIEVAWIDAGAARYRVGSRELVAAAGSIVVVPVGVEHATTLEAGMRGGAVSVPRSTAVELGDALGAPDALAVLAVGAAPRARSIASLLEDELLDEPAGWDRAADALVEALVVEAVRATSGVRHRSGVAPRREALLRPTDPRLRRAVEAIHERYAEPLRIEQLARIAGMSRFHFSRLFATELGSSPYQYLVRVRVERAAEMLRAGGASVTEVAFSVGFADLGRFARAFRAHTGCRPSDLAGRAPGASVQAAAPSWRALAGRS